MIKLNLRYDISLKLNLLQYNIFTMFGRSSISVSKWKTCFIELLNDYYLCFQGINDAAILWLQCVVHVMLFPMINILYIHISTFQSMCTVPIVAVVCSSLESCFPALFLRYFVNDFEMAPVACIITGITSFFTFHMQCIVRSN